jgi:hypothetical protein
MTTPKISSWRSLYETNFKSIDNTKYVNTVILGGDISSLISAYNLMKSGEKVAIVNKKTFSTCPQITGVAFLHSYADINVGELFKKYGEDKTKLIWQSLQKSVDVIEKIVLDENFDCEYEKTSEFIYANHNSEIKELATDYQLGRQLGLNIHFNSISKYGQYIGQLEITNQAKLNVGEFQKQLLLLLKNNGVMILEDTEVLEIDEQNNIFTNTENFSTHNLIVSDFSYIKKTFHRNYKVSESKEYIVEAKIEKKAITDEIMWNLNNSGYFAEIERGETIDHLILGIKKNNLMKRNSKQEFKILKNILSELLKTSSYEICNECSYKIYETSDKFPIIGEVQNNRFLSIGFGENNISFGALAAHINTDLILKYSNRFAEIYSIERFKSPFEFAYENIVRFGNSIKEKFSSQKKHTPYNIYHVSSKV